MRCIAHLRLSEMREDTLVNLEKSLFTVEYRHSQAGGQKVVDMIVREDTREHVKVGFADSLCPFQCKCELRGRVGWNSGRWEDGHISTEQNSRSKDVNDGEITTHGMRSVTENNRGTRYLHRLLHDLLSCPRNSQTGQPGVVSHRSWLVGGTA